MKAEILSKYLAKVKRFAWENGPSAIYSNVLLEGDDKYLSLTCSDGNAGIQQAIRQEDSKILCKCCVNVFKLSSVLDTFLKDSDVSIKLSQGRLLISDIHTNLYLPSSDADQIINIPKCETWHTLSRDMLSVISSVMPATDDSDCPIIYNKKQIYHANPKAVYYREYEECPVTFSVDNKYIKKIFIDDFENIYKNEGQLHLRNKTCKIFIPLFSGNQLVLDPLIKMVRESYTINCKIKTQEVVYLNKIIKQMAELNEREDVILSISKKQITCNVIDSSYTITNHLYEHNNDIKLRIPIARLNSIAKPSFTKNNEYIDLKFTHGNNTIFVAQSDELLFIGGVYRV